MLEENYPGATGDSLWDTANTGEGKFSYRTVPTIQGTTMRA